MIPRAAIHEQEASYQRGLVLGLTMAEMVILIIFVLLLALAALLAREIEKRQQVEQQLAEAQQIAAALHDIAGGQKVAEIIRQLQQQQNVLAAVQTTLQEANLDPTDPQELASALETLQAQRAPAENWNELEEALKTTIPKPTPSEVAALAKEGAEQRAKQAGRNWDDEDAATEEKPLSEGTKQALIESAKAKGLPLVTPADARKLVSDALAGRGKGTDHPSCWYDEDGSTAYLFEVSLRDDGYIILPSDSLQHQEERAELPIQNIDYGALIGERKFLNQTRPVYDWSVDQNCRFFVRAFDQTSATKKALYKRRMDRLEWRFYKKANPVGEFPLIE